MVCHTIQKKIATRVLVCMKVVAPASLEHTIQKKIATSILVPPSADIVSKVTQFKRKQQLTLPLSKVSTQVLDSHTIQKKIATLRDFPSINEFCKWTHNSKENSNRTGTRVPDKALAFCEQHTIQKKIATLIYSFFNTTTSKDNTHTIQKKIATL